ncbi:hypothetical protein KCP69_03595 [Salmonella enterica subsp. enterica]|nr:hypothetical protein KCP69_03595 [Salmonella enterica subsp. enterica]
MGKHRICRIGDCRCIDHHYLPVMPICASFPARYDARWGWWFSLLLALQIALDMGEGPSIAVIGCRHYASVFGVLAICSANAFHWCCFKKSYMPAFRSLSGYILRCNVTS